MIEGPSGSGKTAIAEELEKELGLVQLKSYTNRPKRNEFESNHIFLGESNLNKIKKKYPNRVAETVFDKYFYFSTQEQVNKSDVYVISPDAIEQFKCNYTGRKRIKVVYVSVPPWLRKSRMKRRGDSAEKIEERLAVDKVAFENAVELADFNIRNYVLSDAVDLIKKQLKVWEKEKVKKCRKQK